MREKQDCQDSNQQHVLFEMASLTDLHIQYFEWKCKPTGAS